MVTVVPGDYDYGREVVAAQLDALASRVDDVNKLLDPLLANIRAVGRVVTALELDSDESVIDGFDKIAAVVSGMLDKSSTALEALIERSGVIQPNDTVAEPEPIPAAVPHVTPKRGPKPASDTSEERPQPSNTAAVLFPPILRMSKTPKEAQDLLGKRVYGIERDETERLVELLRKALSVVKISDDGRKLEVIRGHGQGSSTEDLPSTVVRGINIYTRALVSGTSGFKKADVLDLLESVNGVPMADVASKVNSTLGFELHVPELFTKEGVARATRYTPTGKVVFIADGVLTDGSADSAP